MQNFERDPTVGSKVMAIFTRNSSLADHISLSPYSDYIETLSKTVTTPISHILFCNTLEIFR
jgi:hypothetical protein